MWTSCGAASLVKRLSCTGPCGETMRYSSSPSVIWTFAGKVTVAAFLSSRTVPTWKIPGDISFGAENSGGACARSGEVARKAMAIRASMVGKRRNKAEFQRRSNIGSAHVPFVAPPPVPSMRSTRLSAPGTEQRSTAGGSPAASGALRPATFPSA